MSSAHPPGPEITPSVGILTGPSASGKSRLALELAQSYPDIEIVNADSLLVFRGVNVGTAKPSRAELDGVPHHLVDIRDPDQPFTAGDFQKDVNRVLVDIHARKKRALIVGGSGFYLKAVLYGLWDAPKSPPELRAEIEALPSPVLYQELMRLDEPSALRMGVNDRYRLVRAIEIYRLIGKTPSQLESESRQEPYPEYRLWVIDRAGDEIAQRIAERTTVMLQTPGLIDETQWLLDHFSDSRVLGAVGYAQTHDYLTQRKPAGRKVAGGLEGLQSEIELATRQLVKRQRTWFRGEPSAQWFTLDRDEPRLRAEFAHIYGLPTSKPRK